MVLFHAEVLLSLQYFEQYNIHIFNKKNSSIGQDKEFYQAAIAVKITNLLICFCSFDLSCYILEKYIFIKNVLYCLVLLNSILF